MASATAIIATTVSRLPQRRRSKGKATKKRCKAGIATTTGKREKRLCEAARTELHLTAATTEAVSATAIAGSTDAKKQAAVMGCTQVASLVWHSYCGIAAADRSGVAETAGDLAKADDLCRCRRRRRCRLLFLFVLARSSLRNF